MTYSETIDYLFGRLPMFHRIGAAALKPGLDNIINLCNQLGNPQNQLKSIHIAGTNGKGSTANMLSSVLQEAGYKVGLFTSPHLIDFRERIRVNGAMIPEVVVANFVEVNKIGFEQVDASFFEYSTAMAFWYFEQEKVDVAIIETGLGGRLDSTNIILPILSIITSISLDHTYLLGDTVAEIALEKAGIIKQNTAVVVAKNTPEVTELIHSIALQKNAPCFLSRDFSFDISIDNALKGNYQVENTQTVLTAISVLKQQGFVIDNTAIQSGFRNTVKNTQFAGRWQQLGEQPKIIADVAHNEDGIKWVVRQLAEEQYTKLHIVFGVVQDKTLATILPLLPQQASYYFCNANTPRALLAIELADEAKKFSLFGEYFSSVKLAFEAAENQANKDDLIFVGGSVFVVAELFS